MRRCRCDLIILSSSNPPNVRWGGVDATVLKRFGREPVIDIVPGQCCTNSNTSSVICSLGCLRRSSFELIEAGFVSESSFESHACPRLQRNDGPLTKTVASPPFSINIFHGTAAKNKPPDLNGAI